jgi:hypothetical protein
MKNVIFKSKAELRAETEKQVAMFLKRGGAIEVIKARKAPRTKMKGKTTRVASTGTSGFAVGFPRQSLV